MSKGSTSRLLTKITAVLLGLPWIEIIGDAFQLGRKIIRGLANEGMYEILEFESTLTIHDKEGTKATLEKRMKVKYLQDEIIAFQDHGWGEGKALKNYQATPGVPVDEYKVGYKYYVLISLREVKSKGDIDEFNISWDIENGFKKADESWETEISTRMKKVKVSVIFPGGRKPHGARLLQGNIRRSLPLDAGAIRKLPDGSWKMSWSKNKPRLFERYILKWTW